MRYLFVLLTFVSALVCGARAGQAAITQDYYDGICNLACASIGLNIGGPVSGWISFRDGAVSPFATLDETDVLDFAFDLGDVHITPGALDAFDFAAVLDGTASAFLSFELTGSGSIHPDGGASFIIWHSADFAEFIVNVDGRGSAIGAFGIGPLREVPEPGTLALFGAALAGLGLARRRTA
jgi:hypothetical protein